MFQNFNETLFPRRKSPRLKSYDYTTANYYFVTICTYDKKCIFGMPDAPSSIGAIANSGFQMLKENFSDIEIDHAVVMPNHVHAIIVLHGSGQNLSNIVGSYKSYVSRIVHQKYPQIHVWQTSFHDHVIRSRRSYEKIWTYIENNPVKWEEDCFYTAHPL